MRLTQSRVTMAKWSPGGPKFLGVSSLRPQPGRQGQAQQGRLGQGSAQKLSSNDHHLCGASVTRRREQ